MVHFMSFSLRLLVFCSRLYTRTPQDLKAQPIHRGQPEMINSRGLRPGEPTPKRIVYCINVERKGMFHFILLHLLLFCSRLWNA